MIRVAKKQHPLRFFFSTLWKMHVGISWVYIHLWLGCLRRWTDVLMPKASAKIRDWRIGPSKQESGEWLWFCDDRILFGSPNHQWRERSHWCWEIQGFSAGCDLGELSWKLIGYMKYASCVFFNTWATAKKYTWVTWTVKSWLVHSS